MNIKITYNWLLEYLETDANPYELQKYLSLCGPSIETVEKRGDDYILDVEITSNRVDMASVFGVAQETQAILPQFGKKAKLKLDPLIKYSFGKWSGKNKLDVQIKDPKLCPRFTALVMSDVSIKKSPDEIRKRLQYCDVKSINNVIDISNYLMIALGQPVHMFDYDKIGKAKMIVRESKKGETLVTLDEKKITLPGGDIVIEDGNGNLIDLCGIMGGLNSSVTDKTKNVLIFVQAYDKRKVRKTSMLTGQRTMAATYFEKGLDEERVEPTLTYGVELVEKLSGAKVSSQLFDLYPSPYKQKSVSVSQEEIVSRIGVKLESSEIVTILKNLGFGVKSSGNKLTITVPSWRKDDVSIKEDVVEEVARIYGYHNLPVNLPALAYVKRSREMDEIFEMQQKLKYFFKRLGLHESMNYSMVSEEMIEKMNLDIKHHLKLSNSISEDLLYMRTSLLPSLIKNIKENSGKKSVLKFFEIAKVYYPKDKDLPQELYKVGAAVNTSFADAKGIAEALLAELNISNYETKQIKVHTFSKNEIVDFAIGKEVIGSVGKLSLELQHKNALKSGVYLVSFDLLALIEHSRTVGRYQPINPYAVIKFDLTAPIKIYSEFVSKAHQASELLQKVELIDSFKDKKTVRLYFSSSERNLTEKEAQQEFEKVKKAT